jgi:hypothetical protein
MATREELKDKIETIAKRIYAAKTKDNTLGITTDDVQLDKELFPILTKFPTLKQVIINLLTKQYEDFISDIYWVAPRPTTFKILLANSQYFYLIYTERSWIAQVEGKKYYLLNLSEEERAAESIARILMYGSSAEPEKSQSELGAVPTGGETPADETIPEIPASGAPTGEETPPTEAPPTEEVPEEVPA